MEDRKKFDKFRKLEEERSKWLIELFDKHAELVKKCQHVDIEIGVERDIKRKLVDNLADLEKKYEDLQKNVDKSAFVVVLIDADNDGYVFDDKYLIKGIQGGHQAAHDLNSELQKYFERVNPNISHATRMIYVYANIEKQQAAMVRSGMHEAAANLRNFCRGFSQVGGLVNFIDVGDGREQADYQIKGLLEHFKENPCCKHIVLGGCHDNGYVRNLNLMVPDDRIRHRITLLKSFQTGSEYDPLPFKTTRFKSLFRDQLFSSPIQSPTSETASSESSKNGKTNSNTSKRTYAKVANQSVNAPNPSSYSCLLQICLSIDRGEIIVNASGERIDKPLPPPSMKGREGLFGKRQRLGKGPCNMHHLTGQCPTSQVQCIFFHDNLTKAELLALRNEVRRQPCKKGLICKEPQCFYGHNCDCGKDSCKLPYKMHSVGHQGLRKIQVN